MSAGRKVFLEIDGLGCAAAMDETLRSQLDHLIEIGVAKPAALEIDQGRQPLQKQASLLLFEIGGGGHDCAHLLVAES